MSTWCRLCRSLYGLKKAPRAWSERFTFLVTAAGFSESCHQRTEEEEFNHRMKYEYIVFVKACLSEKFLMSDLRPLCYCLGIEVCSTSNGFFIPKRSTSRIFFYTLMT